MQMKTSQLIVGVMNHFEDKDFAVLPEELKQQQPEVVVEPSVEPIIAEVSPAPQEENVEGLQVIAAP